MSYIEPNAFYSDIVSNTLEYKHCLSSEVKEEITTESLSGLRKAVICYDSFIKRDFEYLEKAGFVVEVGGEPEPDFKKTVTIRWVPK